jgi:hypothetical protein
MTQRLKGLVLVAFNKPGTNGKEVEFKPQTALIFGSIALTADEQIIHVSTGRWVYLPQADDLNLLQLARLAKALNEAHHKELDALGNTTLVRGYKPRQTDNVKAWSGAIKAFVTAWVQRARAAQP